MREDEQRFEELEAKLAALSSQVEGLELEKEVDPFLEDDVRRLIEDFREKEIAELEESDDADDDSEDFQDAGFISVQRTQDPSFKVHWITPESCDNLTKETARDAFIAGAAERFGTSQQVHAGDVLILLCRKPIPESGSEPTIPEKFCHYIGMAVNTLVAPFSAEPDTSTESNITDKVGNYEIFVWSSCECSAEEPATVVLPTLFESSSESTTNGNYASIGDDTSPDISTADGLLTSAEIRKDNATGAEDLAKGLSNSLTISTKNAGYKTELVQLSQDLTEYYLDRETKDLSFNADKKNLNTHGFNSDLFISKNLELSNGDCGNLSVVSLAGGTFDLALIREGEGAFDSTFVTTAKVSLGFAVSLGDSVAIETFKTDTKNLEANLALAAGSTVFLPTVSNTNADAIETEVTLESLLKDHNVSIEAFYAVVYESEGLGEAEYWVYQTKTKQNDISWASGLLTSSGTEDELSPELLGIIRTSEVPLTYGCDPEYGCQPDPAGEFFDSSCGSGCPPPSELMLRYRPKNIWRYNEISDSSGTCYEEIAHYELDPAQSTKTSQGYTNGGVFRAELVGGEQVDNFYANGVLVPFDDLYFSELGAEQLCYELTFRPSTVDLYFKAHDPSQPDDFCLRHVSEHIKEAGDTTNRTQAYTNGGEMREVVSVGAGGVVTTKPIFYVDGVPRDPDAAGSSWVLGFDGAVPTVADICTEVTQINYSATGGQNTFSDTITYAETESSQKVSVTLQYNDINNVTGSSYRFEDSSGAQLNPLESYIYAEGNDPLLFTIEIPQGSTGLNVYMNDQGSAGTSTWDINLTAL